MPPLIALGATIGKKSEITPMLRDRKASRWFWPSDDPQGVFYEISGIEELAPDEPELVLRVALTANPEAMDATITMLGHKVVSVAADESVMGNGALQHPIDGCAFMQHMQELLHMLSDQHSVRRVHLLPCASNAACVFLGQAFDSYHPETLIYDFVEQGQPMVPRLSLRNQGNQLQITKPVSA